MNNSVDERAKNDRAVTMTVAVAVAVTVVVAMAVVVAVAVAVAVAAAAAAAAAMEVAAAAAAAAVGFLPSNEQARASLTVVGQRRSAARQTEWPPRPGRYRTAPTRRGGGTAEGWRPPGRRDPTSWNR